MDDLLPSHARGSVRANPGVFEPALIEELGATVGQRDRYQTGKRVHNTAETIVHSSTSSHRSGTGCVTRRATVHETLASSRGHDVGDARVTLRTVVRQCVVGKHSPGNNAWSQDRLYLSAFAGAFDVARRVPGRFVT